MRAAATEKKPSESGLVFRRPGNWEEGRGSSSTQHLPIGCFGCTPSSAGNLSKLWNRFPEVLIPKPPDLSPPPTRHSSSRGPAHRAPAPPPFQPHWPLSLTSSGFPELRSCCRLLLPLPNLNGGLNSPRHTHTYRRLPQDPP